METRANRIDAAMEKIISDNGFGVTQRYPKDRVLDLEIIRSVENSAAQIGWCVGDSHTHIVILGVHPENNEMVDCFTKLSSTDKFYRLSLTGSEDFKLTEVSRAEFSALKSTPIAYSKRAALDQLDFAFFKHDKPIANVNIRSTGTFANRQFEVTFEPLEYMTAIDKRAAEAWANKTICAHIHSLWFSWELVWKNVQPVCQHRRNGKQYSIL